MIYLDSAATTLQKPPAVIRAMADAARTCASPGRGGYAAARKAENILFQCRTTAAELFDADGPEQVVLTYNATHALNLAIRTLVKSGASVVISAWEHNAVTRTLSSIPEVSVRVAEAPLFDDEATLSAFSRLLEQRPDAVVCTAVSNVFGYRLPMDGIAGLCRDWSVPLIVDASQAAGGVPVSLRRWGAAFTACPGHKGLYGPQGTGLLLCSGTLPEPLLTGGTGSDSVLQTMPAYLPDRGEAGTQNVTGAAGLLAGMRFVRAIGVERIGAYETALRRRLAEQLKGSGIRIFNTAEYCQTGVLSIVIPGVDCQEAAERLAGAGIAVRAGLHCAPLAHRSAGTLDSGTVRLSVSALNRPGEMDAAARVLRHMIRTGK